MDRSDKKSRGGPLLRAAVRDSVTLGFPIFPFGFQHYAPGWIGWVLQDEARRLRAERALQTIGSDPRSDGDFLALAKAAYDDETAAELLYRRLDERGRRQMERGR